MFCGVAITQNCRKSGESAIASFICWHSASALGSVKLEKSAKQSTWAYVLPLPGLARLHPAGLGGCGSETTMPVDVLALGSPLSVYV